MLGVCRVEITRRPVKNQRESTAFDGDEPSVITPLGRARVRLGQRPFLRLSERERGIDDLVAGIHDVQEQRGTFGRSLSDWNLNLSFRCRENIDMSLACFAVHFPDKVELA